MQRPVSPAGLSLLLRLAVALGALAIASDAMSVGMDFLSELPASYFTQEDRDMMKKNAIELLDSDEPDGSRDWMNPKTGNSGTIKMRSQFTATDGAPCKRLWAESVVKKGSKKNAGTYTLCKYEGRGWVMHPDAVPAAANPK